MKKILFLFLILIFSSNSLFPQIIVRFLLYNRNISNNILSYTVYAKVTVGQVWHVGSSNIRVTFSGNPVGSLTVHPDNPADSANQNISGYNGYQAMTTTSVGGDVAIGLNILTFLTNGFYTFVGSPTPYRLGRIRFNINPPLYSDTMRFRVPPTIYPTVVYDSLTQLVYNVTYTTGPEPPANINGLNDNLPKEFRLYQNFPNPFNPITSIKFDVPRLTFVKIKVYDVLGKEVSELVNMDMEAGRYEVNWDGTNLASGIYFYRLQTKNYTETKIMLIIK
jgi:hypothetical protein